MYLLLNKDTGLLRFSCHRNAFDEPEFLIEEWFADRRPIGFGSSAENEELIPFLERRRAPKHRQHIQELLARYGCDDTEGFLNITHALSLNDTFWVKDVDSPLTWEDVSLYRNAFDQLISEAAFDGIISETELSSTSPEFGTDGYFAKCWVREGSDIFLYKKGSDLFEIEPVSEYLASQLAACICPDSVPYDLGYHHGALISKCKLFTDETTGFLKASRVFAGREKTIPDLLTYFSSIGSDDTFRRMCVLDAVILNPDRHYGNFGILFDTETMQVLRMAPVFDNNRALLPNLDYQQLLAPDWHIQRCQPKLGRDFILTARGLMTEAIRADLKNPSGFHFAQHPKIKIAQQRLDALSAIVRRQIKAILE